MRGKGEFTELEEDLLPRAGKGAELGDRRRCESGFGDRCSPYVWADLHLGLRQSRDSGAASIPWVPIDEFTLSAQS